ncbi:MAG TPA: hypothetical protein VNT42_10890 [Sphingomonas sp.]|nr:hypothetical protein [Sphingomonas sp.]
MSNRISDLVIRVHQAVVEPALALALRAPRLRLIGTDESNITDISVEWHRAEACRAPCPLHPDKVPRLLRRYASGRARGSLLKDRLRLTPTVIDLAGFDDIGSFDVLLKQRSSRTLSKIRRGLRLGYVARPFMLASHIDDMHAIRTSMAFRAAGPVFDRWFLKPRHIGQPAGEPLAVIPPCCPVHWTIWWGVFAREPGHVQGPVEIGERLVAYVRVMRIGDVVHYTEIMGHRAGLVDNVMLVLHHQIVRWLIEAQEPAARGARALLYGAAEHGGKGLLTWKKRAGFSAGRLRLTEPS